MRKLASIKQITSLSPIDGADFIEKAVVDNGWPVVVRKGEYEVGELVIYLEPDSWVPKELAPFLCKDTPKFFNGVEGERLRTIKLKGQLSQGLIIKLELGLDLTNILGIQKWEPTSHPHMGGDAKGSFPSFVPKTDQERVQNLYQTIFNTDKYTDSYEVTLKLDGSSITVYSYEDEIGVCSRNLDLKDSDTNVFWKTAKDLGWVEAISHLNGYAFQGELMGPKIQGNKEKFENYSIFLFDIWDIKNQCYLTPEARKKLLEPYPHICHAPVIHDSLILSEYFESIDDILLYAEGESINNPVREGVVFKSNTTDFSFKAISNKFLLKNKDE